MTTALDIDPVTLIGLLVPIAMAVILVVLSTRVWSGLAAQRATPSIGPAFRVFGSAVLRLTSRFRWRTPALPRVA